MKPTRKFTADVGDDSVGLGGADTLEQDFDQINKMFDPNSTHTNGEKGGIKRENISTDLEADIKSLENRADGKDTDVLNLQSQINSNDTDISNLQNDKADKSNTYTKTEVDTKENNLQSQIDSNDTDIVNLQNTKADKSNTYTKTEVNSKESNLQNQIDSNDTDIANLQNEDINLQAQITSNDNDISALQAGKSDKANTYTESDVDNLLSVIKGEGYTVETLMSLKNLINGLQTQVDTLNNTFSTDTERIQAINDVINQFEIADNNLNTLIENKANKSDVYTKGQVDSKVFGTGNIGDRIITAIKIGLLQVKNEHLENGIVTADKLADSLLSSLDDVIINARFEKLEKGITETKTYETSMFLLPANCEEGQFSNVVIGGRTETNLAKLLNAPVVLHKTNQRTYFESAYFKNLRENSTYTMLITVSNASGSTRGTFGIYRLDEGTEFNISVPFSNGTHKIVVNTKTTLKDALYIFINSADADDATATINQVSLFEGDKTDEELYHINGTKSTLSMRYKSVNPQNLCDGKWQQGSVTSEGIETDSEKNIRTGYIPIEEIGNYIFSSNLNSDVYAIKFDENKIALGRELYFYSPVAKGTKFPVENGTEYIRLMIYKGDGINPNAIEWSQLEKGIVATECKPYQSSNCYVDLGYEEDGSPRELREVNGVKDEINLVDKTLTIKNDEHTTTNMKTYYTGAEAVDLVRIINKTDIINYSPNTFDSNTISGTRLINNDNNLELVEVSGKSIIYDKIENIGKYLTDANGVWLIVEKGTIESTTVNHTLIYQLAAPIVYQNGENGFSVTGSLSNFGQGTTVEVCPYSYKKYYTVEPGASEITLEYPCSQIDEVLKLNTTTATWDKFDGWLLWEDGSKIGGLTEGKYMISGEIRNEESTIPITEYSVPMNVISNVNSINEQVNNNAENLGRIDRENSIQDNKIGVLSTRVDDIEDEVINKLNQAVINLNYPSVIEHFESKIASPIDVSMNGSMVVNHFNINQNFDKSKVAVEKIKNGIIVANAKVGKYAYTKTENIKVKPNTNYTIKYIKELLEGSESRVRFVRVCNTRLDRLLFDGKGTFNTRENEEIVIVFFASGSIEEIAKVKYTNIMLLEGNWADKEVPYCEGACPLQNPYVELVGENLCPTYEKMAYNGSSASNYIILDEKYLKIQETGGLRDTNVIINVKPNTDYTFSFVGRSDGNVDGGLSIRDKDNIKLTDNLISKANTGDTLCVKTINSGNNTQLFIKAWVGHGLGCVWLKDIILNAGTTAKPYKPYKKSLAIVPTHLAKIGEKLDKVVELKGTKAIVRREIWRVKLDGRLDYSLLSEYSDYKVISQKTLTNISEISSEKDKSIMQKYDGSILQKTATTNNDNCYNLDKSLNNKLQISVRNTDTGWGDSYTPTAFEVKAYMMGWRMYEWGQDPNIPYTSGTKAWCYWDKKSGTGTTTLPTEMAEGFTPYELFYVLEKPYEEEIDLVIPADCEGLNVVEGVNTAVVGSGLVWEKANPHHNEPDKQYRINNEWYGNSFLKNKVNKILKVYKIKDRITVDDTATWGHFSSIHNFGNDGVYTMEENYDTQAEYYVLYEMLHEEYNNQLANVQISYEENLRESFNKEVEHVTELEGDISEINREIEDTLIKGNGERIEEGQNLFSCEAGILNSQAITFRKAFKEKPRVYAVINDVGGGFLGYINVDAPDNFTTRTGFIAFVGSYVTQPVNIKWFAIGK